MKTKTDKEKKSGRPLTMPELIPDTPENIAKALLNQPPRSRSGWKFLRQEKKSKAED